MNNINLDLDEDTKKKLDKYFSTVKSSSIGITTKEEVAGDDNFADRSQAFWSHYDGGKYYKDYDSGVMNGTFNDRRPTYKAILDTFTEAVKCSVRIECERDDKTTEELADFIDLLDKSVNMLNRNLERQLTTKPNGTSLMAHLHGVFNAFIQQNIRKAR